ncbi:hypothetical protein C41B8_19096 [Salinisphaera hydrothermalis C41B8]|uniref:Uncharacterized protein n=1 Tax=Salinisphaera hydrothermalis (strain C41B8) TaxID=1304275 RepID=A0A084IFY4_SALHC|nr:hypothetical protein C41B8_19096 [Salinisphaera hydrothermalis C41B8]
MCARLACLPGQRMDTVLMALIEQPVPGGVEFNVIDSRTESIMRFQVGLVALCACGMLGSNF